MRFSKPFTDRCSRFCLRALSAGTAACLLASALSVLAFFAADSLFPYPKERLEAAITDESVFIEDRNGELVAWRVGSDDQWRMRVLLEDVSPRLVQATIAAEDFRFNEHPGVDPLAVARAAAQNIGSGKRISGASTITMQAVRMVQPMPRTYPNKFIEAFRALQMEREYSKEEILEAYFSLAPYGGNVIGAEAAARRYFGKHASVLTLGEAALLAGLPQRPSDFNPVRNLEAALDRREFVLTRMLHLGMIGEAEAEAARREPIVLAAEKPNRIAPHFADYVIQVCGSRTGTIRTTLDAGAQELVLSEIESVAKDFAGRGIDGTAVVVVDVKSSELLAMVGSAFPDNPLNGCVNGTLAPRQPGSLLKPFIYAAAFDAGILTPYSIVYDVPAGWGGYRPRNMDLEYLGPISVERALQMSRNVPAVRVLDRLGAERLETDMNLLGLDAGNAAEICGLSLALGTKEVRLLDMAGAYATLARLGEFRHVKILPGETKGKPVRIYSKGAAYLALRALGAPGKGMAGRPVWKTGTSWNHRDGWAVAMDPDRLVAVWCGGLSGQGHPAISGATAALPLALGIMSRLSAGSVQLWEAPSEVGFRRVCALSGAPPSRACRNVVTTEYLPGRSSEAPCTLHKFVGEGSDRQVVVVWPKEVSACIGIESCDSRATESRAMRILSPSDGGEYLLAPGNGVSNDSLWFKAACASASDRVFWFMDGELIGSANPGELLEWRMKPGSHELIASTASWESSSVRFTVMGREHSTLKTPNHPDRR